MRPVLFFDYDGTIHQALDIYETAVRDTVGWLNDRYTKEYGTDIIEIHRDAISEDDVCVIHDDLLATGGTTAAAWRLVQKFHPKKAYLSVIINLTDCPKLPEFPVEAPCHSLIEVIENPV